MATELLMPALTPTMEEGTLARWHVAPGDVVEVGQTLAEIETDKSVLEFEAHKAGVVGELCVPEGSENVAVDTPIAILLDDAKEVLPTSKTKSTADPNQVREIKDNVETVVRRDGRVPASPSARRIAKEVGLDIATVPGTGPRGRIVAKDVLDAAQNNRQPVVADSDFVDVPQTTLQKTMARRMVEATTQVPHLYVSIDIRMDTLIGFRETNESSATINDYILRAVALALHSTPKMNVQYHDGVVRQFKHADVAFAVATEHGLMTPIIRQANTKSLQVIASETAALSLRAKSKKLMPEEYDGGTFTVSNVGMLGLTQSWPIINPPQAGILGVGRAEQRPVAQSGFLGIATIMTVTLGGDHRCLDGAICGRFLGYLKDYLESPDKLAS